MRTGTILFAVVLFLGVFAALQVEAQVCSEETIGVTPIQDFNVDKIWYKWWYVQELFWRRPEEVFGPPGDCVTQHLGEYQDAAMLIEDWTETETGDFHRSKRWVGTFWEEPTSIWALTQSPFFHEYLAKWTHTDYETYGVMHICPAIDGTAVIPYERVLVFTGESNPNATLLEELRGMVAGLGFPTEYSVKVKHSHDTNCTYCTDCPIYDTENDDNKDNDAKDNGVALDFEE